MSRSLNQVTLLGNLTRDPELHTLEDGKVVANFSIALNRPYKTESGEWKEVTDFVDVVTWERLAERVSEHLKKGSRALVIGRLQNRSFEKEGIKQVKTSVVASDVTFLDGKGREDEQT
jgi:single-strand DNA-binding protein